MAIISFNNHGVSPSLKSKPLLKIFLSSIFAEEKTEFKKISYIFCSDEFLLKLNQQYLNHDTLTDIITFTLSETSLPIISEIYISIERVEENAVELKVDYDTELIRVMIHGVLHLCGYSDHTPELKSEMRAKEDYYLKKWGAFY
jgi:probable rRNA maturation factor